MKDHGLDLAVIGNGRTAALVDPTSRIVWWCYPRFDGDPIFCRLLAGKQEKGFSDVVLDDMIQFGFLPQQDASFRVSSIAYAGNLATATGSGAAPGATGG